MLFRLSIVSAALLAVGGVFATATPNQDCVGYLEPGRSIKVSAAEPGIVRDVRVREGQHVKAGDVLVKLDTDVFDLEAKIAEEEFALISRRVERLRNLLPQKFASDDELLRAESELRITALRKEKIEAQIERLTLRSPIDGVVTELRYDVAEGVTGANSHVATVVQLQPMQVQFNLPLAIAAGLSHGESVEVEFPDFRVRRMGEVVYVSPVSIAVVNTVRVKVQIPEPENLPAGIKAVLVRPSDPALSSTTPNYE